MVFVQLVKKKKQKKKRRRRRRKEEEEEERRRQDVHTVGALMMSSLVGGPARGGDDGGNKIGWTGPGDVSLFTALKNSNVEKHSKCKDCKHAFDMFNADSTRSSMSKYTRGVLCVKIKESKFYF